MRIFIRILFKLTLVLAVSVPIMVRPMGSANAGWLTSLPYCEDDKVHSKIVKRFNKADRTLWYTGVEIRHLSSAVETAQNPFAYSDFNRRYCRANAYLSNGRKSVIHFLVEEGMGLAGTGWNVEFCVPGTDQWNAYGGWCRVLRK